MKTPGLAYTTVTVPDLDRAEQVYVEGLGGTLLHKGESELTGTSDVYVQVGDTVVQLSRPTRDGTLAAEDFEKFGNMHHAAAFKVQDLDATKEYFDSKGIATLARDDQTLIALKLNGNTLNLDHGYPCRLIAPSRPGVLQTKWLARIEVVAS